MKNLRIAIQKSGRLSEKCLSLLNRCGLQFDNRKRTLISRAKNHPVELMLVRDDDIPHYVRDGVCDIGIVGLNELEEKIGCSKSPDNPVKVIRSLGFGSCRLSLAWPKSVPFEGLESFSGKRIATSYPNILERYLESKSIAAEAVEISGSVEVTPSIGVADAICDLVSTGATLDSNGLKEVITILESEAVLVRSNQTLESEQEDFLTRLLQRIDGTLLAQNANYIMMNAPKSSIDEIAQYLPGMETPTVVPLSTDSSKVAIHAVAQEDVVWETMEQLKRAGASSILVLPIEKIIE
ncbi:ATP phosphoribosyltransferase [Pseudobacteriovorax antillogorgiicola]|uniref:ATP phosphoribosyltransferase n=1 Tax=Pseudobacteriovorax antillogorgiicola TaxID=1513793 RepID=A0A1Y6CN74_9BACT|nr:ATP phosphoribosyltransferase [Pseudobacteriovorax antillogorgiicola]TCS44616.1 ATP phosphoribosyltransferase (homohexameric) [Pseudobacteriovorax antillogorgiicola]SMF78317.1 ATP phosphoribosyltransferase (homohexameric) [Pseudobacteriovorax antillogorgiicola]